jgi:hypothetical protein
MTLETHTRHPLDGKLWADDYRGRTKRSVPNMARTNLKTDFADGEQPDYAKLRADVNQLIKLLTRGEHAKPTAKRGRPAKVEADDDSDDETATPAQIGRVLKAKNAKLAEGDASYRWTFARTSGKLVLLRKCDAESGKPKGKNLTPFVLAKSGKLRVDKLHWADAKGNVHARA